MATALDLSYPKILKQFSRYLVDGRTESRSFVAWFLEHFYRLDVDESLDAICDGPDDKGIDGIYVDETYETIDVFQAKLFQKVTKTLGDTLLKEFVGTLSQFKDATSLANLEATTGNSDLKKLIKDLDLDTLLKKGWKVRGVFITNARHDKNAKTFLSSHKNLILWDHTKLSASYLDTAPPAPQKIAVSLDISGFDVVHYKTTDAQTYIAAIKAADLLKLEGLKNGALFAWNVRQSLGRTKVNKEIAESIQKPSEHKNFLLYHNGLTVLCQKVKTTKDTIVVEGYNVVNGCQSLTTLADHDTEVTNELRLITRIVQLKPDSPLAAEITRRSNNQNAISARDLQSNSILQRRLQKEIKRLTNDTVFYEIKRGEAPPSGADYFTNDEAARILLAFDLAEPWSCHQGYKLFDELHSQIFGRPEVNGSRLLGLRTVYESTRALMPTISEPLVGSYRLTRYFLLYLLKQALLLDPKGQEFCKDPGSFYQQLKGEKRITKCVTAVLKDLIVDLNAELKDRSEKGTPFDYKRELKSPTAVKAFALQIIPLYQKALQRKRVKSFTSEWSDA